MTRWELTADVIGSGVVQEQVEQNLAVRCMQSVGNMLATMRIDQVGLAMLQLTSNCVVTHL